jgi:hypothetical protein
LKSQNSRNPSNKKQKYISVNKNLLQVKESQIQKEKDKQKKAGNYLRLISKENKEIKKKEEEKKIEKKRENKITGGVGSVIPPINVIENTSRYQPVAGFDVNSINIEELSKTK